ncbi:MAG: osmotically inducible protein C [Myxococcales bacterium SG8_38]|nr:MAG: osmotically inducible protein C [Myxococcales bacterium SG8_38]
METNATTETNQSKPRREKRPLNGVDVPTLFATINAVAEQPELAKFQFRASNEWIKGTHSRSRIEGYSGAGGEHAQTGDFVYDGDHPPVLCGAGNAPTPVEFLLHALAACITAGIGNVAAARGVTLESVESRVEGDIDLRGLLGISDQVRNGYQGIRLAFKVKGDADAETLRKIVAQSQARSAVYDVLTNGVPVSIEVDAD